MDKNIEKLFDLFKTTNIDNERRRSLDRIIMKTTSNDYDIKDNHYEPKPGDKVLITNFREPIDGNLVARISREKYSIVESAFPIPIGSDGNYHFEYEITIKNGDDWTFMEGDYHILTEKEINKLEKGFRLL